LEAMALYKEFGHRYHEADEYDLLGEVHLTAGRIGLARVAWQHAISILNEVGHPDVDKVRSKLASLSKLVDMDDSVKGSRQRSTVGGTIDSV
jgi:hypothetical protein